MAQRGRHPPDSQVTGNLFSLRTQPDDGSVCEAQLERSSKFTQEALPFLPAQLADLVRAGGDDVDGALKKACVRRSAAVMPFDSEDGVIVDHGRAMVSNPDQKTAGSCVFGFHAKLLPAAFCL